MAEEGNKNKKLEDIFGSSSRTNKEKLQSLDNTAKAIAQIVGVNLGDLKVAAKSQVKASQATGLAVKDTGKSNKLKAKEDKNEMQLFFKDLIGEFKSTFKDAKDAVVKPFSDKSIFGIGKMILMAIPALGAGLVAGFLGPIVGIFKKIPFIGKALKAFKGVMGFFTKVLSPILKVFKPVISLVSKVVKPFVGVFKYLLDGLKPILALFGPLFKGSGGIFKIFFKFGKVLGKLVWPITILIGIVEGAIAAVKEWQAGGSIVDIIGKFFAGIVSSLTFGLYDSDKSIGENFKGLITWIGDLFGSIGNWIREIGPTVLGWIDMGIMYFKNLLDSVVFWVQFELPQFLRDAMGMVVWYFTDFMPGLVVKFWGMVWDFFTGDGFLNMMSAIWDFLKEVPMMFIDVWASVYGFIWGFVKGIGGTLMGVLTDIVMWLGVKILDIQAAILGYIDETLGFLSPLGDSAKAARENAENAHRYNEARKAENALLAEEERKLAEEQRELKQAERERVRIERQASRDANQATKMAKYAKPSASGQELQVAQADAVGRPPSGGGAQSRNTNVNTIISNKNEAIHTGGMTVRDNSGPQFLPA